MKLSSLKPTDGARQSKVRVGRGTGSGCGKTSGRGHKGQNSRSGGGVRPGFEGGQMPIYRRLPKRGFKNIWRKDYAAVDVTKLNAFEDGEQVNVATLIERGILKKAVEGIRIIGKGSLTKKVSISCKHITAGARAAVEKSGSTVEVL